MTDKQYRPSEALKILGNGLYEIRVVDKTSYAKSMYSSDLDSLDKKLAAIADGKSNFYFSLGKLNSALSSRPQSEQFKWGKGLSTTSDNDVVAYSWLLVDLDPTRPSDVASSDEEKNHALVLSRKIYLKLLESGVPKSSIIVADSGNGYHLLIKVDFETSKENINIVKSFLDSLGFLFSDEHTQVDLKNFNPSRITKLYGTVAHKGMNTKERPHRRSNLIAVPENIEVCPIEVIESISKIKPETQRHSTSSSTSNGNFNANQFIDEFVAKHNIRIIKDSTVDGVRRMVLAECPFDHNHGQDAMIGVAENKPFFSCFHNGCSDNHWREFRLIYEPDFEKEREEKKAEYNAQKEKAKSQYQPKNQKLNVIDMVRDRVAKSDMVKSMEKKATPLDETKDWFNLVDGLEAINFDGDVEQGFATGFKALDGYLQDGILAKGTFSIISGDNSSGKSTFINQLVLNVANQGYKSMIYSGELVVKRFTKWILRQACGTENMRTSKGGKLYVPDTVATAIAQWAKDRIFLYNNKKSQKVSEIIDKIIKCIEQEKVELVVVDNLMSMETEELGNDFGVDKQIIKALIDIAKNYNVHTILVAHPRKSNGYLRKNDIAGEKNISNLADNVFIMHRNNDDFKRAYYEYKTGKKWYEGCREEFADYGNILEICKNRDNGAAIDKKVPFYFDVNSSRFLEEPNQRVIYGWQNTTYVEEEIKDADDIPFE